MFDLASFYYFLFCQTFCISVNDFVLGQFHLMPILTEAEQLQLLTILVANSTEILFSLIRLQKPFKPVSANSLL